MSVLMVVCSCPDQASAAALAQTLVERRLAACVNLLPPMQSVYRWQGQIEHASEVQLLAKTTALRLPALKDFIVRHHPYEIPEILAFPASDGLPSYLRWVEDETLPATAQP